MSIHVASLLFKLPAMTDNEIKDLAEEFAHYMNSKSILLMPVLDIGRKHFFWLFLIFVKWYSLL